MKQRAAPVFTNRLSRILANGILLSILSTSTVLGKTATPAITPADPEFQLCFETVGAKCFTVDAANPGVLRQSGALADYEAKLETKDLLKMGKDLEIFFDKSKAAAPRGKAVCSKPAVFRILKLHAKNTLKESVRCREKLSKTELTKLNALAERLAKASNPSAN